MPRQLITISFLCICILHNSYGQPLKEKKSGIGYNKGKVGVFINMVSFLEGANGAGISYHLSPKCHISAEPSYLTGSLFRSTSQTRGFRMTFTAKRFFVRDVLFYGIDARVKSLWYTDVQDFVNPVIPDTLLRYSHHVNKTIYAAGFIFGVKVPFPKTKKLQCNLM